ncbi:MAG: type II secretion system protein GspM [Halorhodospira sp.]
MSLLERYNYLAPLNRALWERAPRERVLLGVAVFALIAALWYYMSFEPGQRALEDAQSEFEQAEEQIENLQQEREELRAELEENPDERLREDIARLEDELEGLRSELGDEMPEFIDPGRMRQVLEELLARREGVELVSFQRLPAELLLESEGEGSDDDESVEIYRQPLRMVLEADYPSTVRFLSAVEGLPWEFAWEELTYEVTEHPQARIEIQLYTLSGYKVWLGI